MASFVTRRFQASMLLGELVLLCVAALDRLLQAVSFGVLRISAVRPVRPSASQFARQQKQFATTTSTTMTTSASSTPTTTSTSPTATTQAGLDAVIIGGGAAGVSTAAALSRAGLSSAVVLERNGSPGDVWRKRYASLTLHDIADDVSLPFVEIPESLPTYVPAGVFADYLDFHARIHRVDFRGGTEAVSVEPISSSGSSDRWRVRARPVGAPPSSPTSTFEAENVVFCDGGLYNSPKIPSFARAAWEASNRRRQRNDAGGKKGDKRAAASDEADAFEGEVVHSSQLSSRDGSCSRFAGKSVLVVGFGNSAMDVVQELVAANARSVVVAVREPSRRAVVPLLAYGAYQEQLARYPWLTWPEKAATFLEERLKEAERRRNKGGDDDDLFDRGAVAALASRVASSLLATLVAPLLGPLLRRIASDVDFLLDAATAARSVRAWAALGARGGDLSPYGLSTLPSSPGRKPDCGPVTWTKRTANVLVMDTGAVKEVIRGNARVVVASVERLGPERTVSLKPSIERTSSTSPAPTSASPLTASLLRSVGGEVPGGEAPVLAPAPPKLDGVDAVVLCTGFDTMRQCYSLISDEETRERLGGSGASGYLVPPEQRGSGAIECGRSVEGVEGMYFVYGRLTQVRDGALEVASRVARERERKRWAEKEERASKGATAVVANGTGAKGD